MKTVLTLAALAALTTTVAAQTVLLPQNKFRNWDQTTEYTSRGSMGGWNGSLSQAFPSGLVMGVPNLSYIQYVAQDQDLKTPATFDLIFTALDATGLPDYKNASTIVSAVALPTTTAGGVGAYIITHNLNGDGKPGNNPAPFAIPSHKGYDPNEQWHFGWKFTSKDGASWTTDGPSVHMSNDRSQLPVGQGDLCQFDTTANRVYHAEIPRKEKDAKGAIVAVKEDLAYSDQDSTNGAKPPSLTSSDRAWRVDLGSTVTVLSVASDNKVYNGASGSLACLNPNTGYAGIDPEFNNSSQVTANPRYDNPVWLIDAGTNGANNVAVLLFSQAVFPAGVPTPWGNLWVDLGDFLFLASPFGTPVVLDTQGKGSFTFDFGLGGTSNTLRPLVDALPHWHAQAFVVNPTKGTATLSSLASLRPALLPAGFTADDTTDGSNSGKIAKVKRGTVGGKPAPTVYVRNDGPGLITVQGLLSNGAKFGPAIKVAERTAQRITIAGPVADLEIKGNKAKSTQFLYKFGY
jgi:hypothetical protein